MLCSECNKNPAILFYKKIENGKESLEGYCYDCAKSKGINQAILKPVSVKRLRVLFFICVLSDL